MTAIVLLILAAIAFGLAAIPVGVPGGVQLVPLGYMLATCAVLAIRLGAP